MGRPQINRQLEERRFEVPDNTATYAPKPIIPFIKSTSDIKSVENYNKALNALGIDPAIEEPRTPVQRKVVVRDKNKTTVVNDRGEGEQEINERNNRNQVRQTIADAVDQGWTVQEDLSSEPVIKYSGTNETTPSFPIMFVSPDGSQQFELATAQQISDKLPSANKGGFENGLNNLVFGAFGIPRLAINGGLSFLAPGTTTGNFIGYGAGTEGINEIANQIHKAISGSKNSVMDDAYKGFFGDHYDPISYTLFNFLNPAYFYNPSGVVNKAISVQDLAQNAFRNYRLSSAMNKAARNYTKDPMYAFNRQQRTIEEIANNRDNNLFGPYYFHSTKGTVNGPVSELGGTTSSYALQNYGKGTSGTFLSAGVPWGEGMSYNSDIIMFPYRTFGGALPRYDYTGFFNKNIIDANDVTKVADRVINSRLGSAGNNKSLLPGDLDIYTGTQTIVPTDEFRNAVLNSNYEYRSMFGLPMYYGKNVTPNDVRSRFSLPIMIDTKGIHLGTNPFQLVYYKKSGGKLKEGSKIHIKKENRGKFTEYCKGKVTDECIQKGKHSSDPKIRKRATFAQSVRKWNKKK